MAARAQPARLLSLLLLAMAALAAVQFSLHAQAESFVSGGTVSTRPLRLRTLVAMKATASPETMEKVADVVSDQLDVDKSKVVREATLTELGADSLDIVESVMALEEAFDVELPDDETTSLKNVGDVADLIETKRND